MIDTKVSLRNLTKPNYGQPKKKQHPPLQELTRPHVDSFNHMLQQGLTLAVKDIVPVQFALPNGQRVSLYVKDAFIASPCVPEGNQHATTIKVYPAECRERGTTYRGHLTITVGWDVNGQTMSPIERQIGEVPIMVKSMACNLDRLSPAELIRRGEEAEEMGGYFIVNGIERIIRMLIMPRRNFPTAISRPSWKNRGPQYTEFGIQMRCVKADQTSANLVLHYLNNGTATLSFTHNKEQFFVPVILVLKALVEVTDHFIFTELMKGKSDDSFYKGCIANMLRQAQDEGLTRRQEILKYIGERFRVKLTCPEWYTDVQVAEFLFKECICIHLNKNMDKFNILVYMTRKLFAFAKGQCVAENADNPMFQEVLLAGHLYQKVLKEKIENWLMSVKTNMEREGKLGGQEYSADPVSLNSAMRRGQEAGRPMEFLMATGNLMSRTGLGLMQASGLTVVADKLNFIRYISHFRCVHRGAFFAEMRTTAVRKLLPEAWGFLCPVHTPDGSPCGLMNHMSATCQVVNALYPVSHLPRQLCELGMVPYDQGVGAGGGGEKDRVMFPVMMDGQMVGWVEEEDVEQLVGQLRMLKVKGANNIPRVLEICYVPRSPVASQYPGVYLFSTPARMVRPVMNLLHKRVEMLGSFEQVYMDIAVTPGEAVKGVTTHQELSESAMLSTIASLTPYSDFNQSPRNMYQCQMGKQTMGTPLHALQHRSDNKLYRIQTPQSPLCRPAMYDYYGIDEYPLGTCACVAVISYTGYDMEDAMILNKGAHERGFAHGSVYKAEFINLRDVSHDRGQLSLIFGNKPGNKSTEDQLDADGLPFVGTYLQQGDVYYSYLNVQTGELKVEKYKSAEPAHVDHIKVLGDDKGEGLLQKICIMLRITRNPIIGDKFASRHGQKGVCSQKWPVADMPFTETGMQPDILFNPHGFPSRMTIGMMIESMASKSAASHGLVHDATPFTFSEDKPAIDYFGDLLVKAGYNYFGTERMYSGITGREFEADIFVGIVYYQRLRHMVSDKFQVRTTGPYDQLTKQPVKGRKRGGGVRFGEMERDGLLSHGTSFLLQDRLLLNSDYSKAHICRKCGSIISPLMTRPSKESSTSSYEKKRSWRCMGCQEANTVELVMVPYVFRYLCAELAAMNIKLTLEVKQ